MFQHKINGFKTLLASGALLAASVASAGDGTATVRMSYTDRADGVFPVRVVKINGEESAIAREREVIEVPSGEHTLTVSALIDQRWVRGPQRRIDLDSDQSVTHVFEAGKTYYIAAKLPDSARDVEIIVGEWDARGDHR